MRVISKRNILLTGLILGMFFASLDQTVVGTALPRIIGDLGGLDILTWVTTAYVEFNCGCSHRRKVGGFIWPPHDICCGNFRIHAGVCIVRNQYKHDGADYLPWTAGSGRGNYDAHGHDYRRRYFPSR